MTELNTEQRQAVESILESQSTLVCGGAGTGKTFTLQRAVHELEEAGKRYLLIAPTGKAALRMRSVIQRPASTIHRLLYNRNVDSALRNIDVVIVDEASMVDSELMGELSRKLLTNNCRIVLVGDPNQLPPVGPGKPFEDIITSKVLPTVELKTIYRQKGDSWVLDNAWKVLEGVMVDLEDTHDFTFIETEEIEGEALQYLGRQWKAERNPSNYQVISPQRVDNQTYDSGATTGRINKGVQDHSEPDGPGIFDFEWGQKFRTGDRIIQTTNNYTVGVVNGQQGVITQATTDGVFVKFDESFDEERGPIWYSDLAGSEANPSPRELDLSYAITVHKSQGNQFLDVFFAADKRHTRMLQRRLFYTAITRTERHLTIAGSREAVQRAIKTNMVNDRNTLLQAKLQGKYDWFGSKVFGV
jgi:exodeoxyribonuclease V alpha subunit